MSSLIVLIVVLAIIIVPVVSLPLQRRARSPPITPARDMLADAISRQGPEWQNPAASVRAGYANVWIIAGLAAIDEAVRMARYDDDPQ